MYRAVSNGRKTPSSTSSYAGCGDQRSKKNIRKMQKHMLTFVRVVKRLLSTR